MGCYGNVASEAGLYFSREFWAGTTSRDFAALTQLVDEFEQSS
jgi:hypothetical protein